MLYGCGGWEEEEVVVWDEVLCCGLGGLGGWEDNELCCNGCGG